MHVLFSISLYINFCIYYLSVSVCALFIFWQDISGVLGEGSEFGDSGIDGVTAEIDGDGELVSRRCKAMSASFSVYSATESSVFNGSDSGSSSAGGLDGRGGGEGGRGGVYENFRKELDNQAWVSFIFVCMSYSFTQRRTEISSCFNHLFHRHVKVGTARRKWALLWVMSRVAARSVVHFHRMLWLAPCKAPSGKQGLLLWRTSWFIRKTKRWNLQRGASGNTTGFLWKVLHLVLYFYV